MINVIHMQEIAISKFKATCLAVMEQVRRTRQPVLVTRFGEAVAEIVPPSPRRVPLDGLAAWLIRLKSRVT